MILFHRNDGLNLSNFNKKKLDMVVLVSHVSLGNRLCLHRILYWNLTGTAYKLNNCLIIWYFKTQKNL